ncbi:MAG: hypothetical protein JHC33_15360, partial [Ignisphaera sp.]|nr:hypothetical protein [Ignisphaera sp.]
MSSEMVGKLVVDVLWEIRGELPMELGKLLEVLMQRTGCRAEATLGKPVAEAPSALGIASLHQDAEIKVVCDSKEHVVRLTNVVVTRHSKPFSIAPKFYI